MIKENMTIKYKLDIADSITFAKRDLKKNNLLFQNLGFILVIPIIYLFLFQQDWMLNIVTINKYEIPRSIIENKPGLKEIYISIVSIVIFFLLRYIIIQIITNQLKKFPYSYGERELVLDEEKLIFKMLHTCIEYNYKIIYYIELVDDYCYLRLCDRSTIIIPKRTQGFDDFVAKLKEKYKQHS